MIVGWAGCIELSIPIVHVCLIGVRLARGSCNRLLLVAVLCVLMHASPRINSSCKQPHSWNQSVLFDFVLIVTKDVILTWDRRGSDTSIVLAVLVANWTHSSESFLTLFVAVFA